MSSSSSKDSNAGGKKLRALHDRLQRVAQTWSAILMYRAEMNRFETIVTTTAAGPSSGSSSARYVGKKSEHFLNDTFDHFFFEALYLLVEYTIEARFLDLTKPMLGSNAGSSTTAATATGKQTTAASAASSTAGHSVNASIAPSVISSNGTAAIPPGAVTAVAAAAAATKAPGKSSTASAALLAQQVESNWRLAQHELQRILRSRNFFAATRRRKNAAFLPQDSGNGLLHTPLSTSALQAAAAAGPPGSQSARRAAAAAAAVTSSSAAAGKLGPVRNSASYRSPATFRMDGYGSASYGRSSSSSADGTPFGGWDPSDPSTAFLPSGAIDDDAGMGEVRALSHLPGHFRSKNSFGILDCLDLRSPIVAAVLPNPRVSLRSSGISAGTASGGGGNESYVFGSEPRRGVGPSGLPRPTARLTHAEERYLTQQHRLQLQRAMEWRLKQEREATQSEQQDDDGAAAIAGVANDAANGIDQAHDEKQEEPQTNSNRAAGTRAPPPPLLQVESLQQHEHLPPGLGRARTIASSLSARGSLEGASSALLQPTPPAAPSARSRAAHSAGSLSARSPHKHTHPTARPPHFVAHLSPRSSSAQHAHASMPRLSLHDALSSLTKSPPQQQQQQQQQRRQPPPLVRIEGNRISLAECYLPPP
jgi:hypothetical protein